MTPALFTNLEATGEVFQTLYSWKSPERHWTQKDRAWYVSYSTFFVLIIAVLAILSEYILIVAVIAFVFLWFTQAAIPPQIVTHTINTLGVRTFSKTFKWKNIQHFWFSEKSGVIFLHLEIVDEILFKTDRVRRLSLIVNPEDEVSLFNIMLQSVDYGDKDEIGFNIFARLLHGKYIDVNSYLPEEMQTEEQFNEGAIMPAIPAEPEKKKDSKKHSEEHKKHKKHEDKKGKN